MLLHEKFSEALELGLKAECFVHDQARAIFEAMKKLFSEKIAIDLSTIITEVPTCADFLISCSEYASVLGEISHPVSELLKEIWRRNAANGLANFQMRLSRAISQNEQELIITDFRRFLECDLSAVQEVSKSIDDEVTLDATLAELENWIEMYKTGTPRGIPTGFKSLDEFLAGWLNGKLYLIAARTSVGKTAIAVQFANHAAKLGKKVLFFSNEMDNIEIYIRRLSLESGIPIGKLMKGDASEKELDRLVAIARELFKFRMKINLDAGTNLEKFELEIRRLKRKEGLDMVVLDYIQQMSPEKKGFKPKHLELAEVSGRLKQLARDLKIPILALAQINREFERGGSKQSSGLANLKDSGSLEQDADAVIILSRSEVARDDDKVTFDYYIEVAKNRSGKTGKTKINADLARNRFTDF